MKKFVITLCLYLSCIGRSHADDFKCDSIDFCSAVQKVEANYAGFHTKVNATTIEEYNRLKDRLYKSILKENRHGYDAAAEYVAWFNDRHLALGALSEAYMKPRISYDSINYNPQFISLPIDDNSYLIRIPNFSYDEKIFSFIKKAITEYLQSGKENLIIDIRGNSGGVDMTWTPLFELIYDKPFHLSGIEFRATPDIANFMRETYKAQNGQPSWALTLADSIDRTQASFIPIPMSNAPITLDTISPFPKKAAIIMDNYVASSAEQFLIISNLL